MHKIYKYRVYPNKTQQKILNEWSETVRYVYNCVLALKIYENEKYKRLGKDYSSYNIEWLREYDINKQIAELKSEFSFLKEPPSKTIEYEVKHLFVALKKFYNGAGFPKFRKKDSSMSLIFRRVSQNDTIDFCRNKINLPKLKGIKARFHRHIEEKQFEIKLLNITKDNFEKYYCTIIIELEDQVSNPQTIKKPVGIDIGIINPMVFSDGFKVENPKIFESKIEELRNLRRQLAKKSKNSLRYNKTKQKIAKLYNKINLQRDHFNHSLSKKITEKYDAVFMEKLGISEMTKSAKGTIEQPGVNVKAKSVKNRKFLDISPFSIMKKIEYKAHYKGLVFKQIDRFEPTTKKCNRCDFQNEKLTLDDRYWVCPYCNEKHDRDINAAKNILKIGLKNLKFL